MVGSCDSIKGGNFNSIFLINRHKLTPKLGLIYLIRVEFLEVVISTGKLPFDAKGQIALEISLQPWREGKGKDRTPTQLLSSEQQGTQAVVFKIPVRYAASVHCRKCATSGEPAIKNSKPKCHLNNAEYAHVTPFTHRKSLQGKRRHGSFLGDTHGSVF